MESGTRHIILKRDGLHVRDLCVRLAGSEPSADIREGAVVHGRMSLESVPVSFTASKLKICSLMGTFQFFAILLFLYIMLLHEKVTEHNAELTFKDCSLIQYKTF